MENEIEKGVRDKSSSETREVIRLKYSPFTVRFKAEMGLILPP